MKAFILLLDTITKVNQFINRSVTTPFYCYEKITIVNKKDMITIVLKYTLLINKL